MALWAGRMVGIRIDTLRADTNRVGGTSIRNASFRLDSEEGETATVPPP
jgi:hypothetical protein